jgi:hypothetical protein
MVAAAGLAALTLAAAGAADRPQLRFTAADTAAAKSALVRRADLGTTATWSGGSTAPEFNGLQCPGYEAKLSDLAVTGAAAATWKAGGGVLEVDTQATVLRTAHMVALDWQRTVTAPQALQCQRKELVRRLGSSGRLVSFAAVPFPHVAAYVRAYRAVVETGSGTQAVRVVLDAVLFGRSRTEISIVTSAPLAHAASVAALERYLALALAARIRA